MTALKLKLQGFMELQREGKGGRFLDADAQICWRMESTQSRRKEHNQEMFFIQSHFCDKICDKDLLLLLNH